VRPLSRLLAAIGLVASAGAAAEAAPAAPPPFVLEKRATPPTRALGKLADLDEANAERVCTDLEGKDAEVRRQAARNRLYGTRTVGIEP
jgi:hypothetical protein